MGDYRAAIAAVMVLVLGGCATVSTTTLESQSRQRDARLARLYFIWPRSWMMRTGTLDIKVNGDVVGKIAPDSYFFIDRKPGSYTLRIEPPFDFTYFEADVQVMAGQAYYYSVNSRATTVGPLASGGFVTMNPTPSTGAPIEAKSGTMGDLQAESDGCRCCGGCDERLGCSLRDRSESTAIIVTLSKLGLMGTRLATLREVHSAAPAPPRLGPSNSDNIRGASRPH